MEKRVGHTDIETERCRRRRSRHRRYAFGNICAEPIARPRSF